MYEIKYNQYDIKLNTIDEVIQHIIKLHNEFKTMKTQMILLKFKNISLELGLGYKDDKIVLLFTNTSSLEDSLLSFTGTELQNPITFDRKDLFPFECNEHNLIPIIDALQEVEYILFHGSISSKLNWYSN